MKGEAEKLIKFLDGSDKRFVIPLYQRNYDWKIENCKQLFDDLMRLRDPDKHSHFFGSIVACQELGTENLLIIDGQQRITTVSILLTAMVNASKCGDIMVENRRNQDKVYEEYIVDKYKGDEIKLRPIKKDRTAFSALVKADRDLFVKGSNITRNYEYFYNEIKKLQLSLDALLELVKKLEVVTIRLEAYDDPQLIFESLNSTGLDLSEADKIRNYLLMSLSSQEQEEMYEKYWSKIEMFTEGDVSNFVRDYLTIVLGKITRMSNVYAVFKDFASKGDKKQLLEELHVYAKIYGELRSCVTGVSAVNLRLKRISTLESSVAYPFYMPLLHMMHEEKLSEQEACKCLDIVESLIARRIICDYPSNGLNKVFATLFRELSKRKEEADNDFSDILAHSLLSRTGTASFPTDGEVRTAFATRNVYGMNKQARLFLFERLENKDSKELHDVVRLVNEGSISIEHIMPQSLSAKWKEALGDDYDKVHQQYLHTMANLTLTAYNSDYSNHLFCEKRDAECGFKSSAFRLNAYVSRCEEWTEKQLVERYELLLADCFKLWPKPVTSYEPHDGDVEAVPLDDEDYDFRWKSLKAFRFRGQRFGESVWRSMLVHVCKLVHQESPVVVQWLCENSKYGLTKDAAYSAEFASGLYVKTHSSTTEKISLLRKLLAECGIPLSELSFEFKIDKSAEDAE